eukprot:tig00000767_g3974.t1
MSADFEIALSRDAGISLEDRLAAFGRLSAFEQRYVHRVAFNTPALASLYSTVPESFVPDQLPRPVSPDVNAENVAKAAADGTVFVLSAAEIPAYLEIVADLAGKGALFGAAAVMVKSDPTSIRASDVDAIARSAAMLRTIVPFAVVEPPTPSAKGPTVAGYQFQCGCDVALIKDPSTAVSLTPSASSGSTQSGVLRAFSGPLSVEKLVEGVRGELADHPAYGPALQPAEAPAAEETPESDETLEACSWDPLKALAIAGAGSEGYGASKDVEPADGEGDWDVEAAEPLL